MGAVFFGANTSVNQRYKEVIKIVSLAREVLANISQRGVIHYTVVADMMRIGHYYAQLICRLLGRDDYIVIDAVGRCKITPKGRNLLKEKTLSE